MSLPQDDPDLWFSGDKALHFACSAGVVLVVYVAVAGPLAGVRWRVVLAIAAGMAVGLAKEAWDFVGHGDCSWKDVAWDTVGIAVAVVAAAAADLAMRRRALRRPAPPAAPGPTRASARPVSPSTRPPSPSGAALRAPADGRPP